MLLGKAGAGRSCFGNRSIIEVPRRTPRSRRAFALAAAICPEPQRDVDSAGVTAGPAIGRHRRNRCGNGEFASA